MKSEESFRRTHDALEGIAKKEAVEMYEDVDIGKETADDQGDDALAHHILETVDFTPCHTYYGKEHS